MEKQLRFTMTSKSMEKIFMKIVSKMRVQKNVGLLKTKTKQLIN